MLIYESEEHPYWIMYPGACHALQIDGDWLTNDQRCTLNDLIRVAVREWPAYPDFDPDFAVQTAEFVDGLVESLERNPDFTSVRRDSITTHQGRTMELIWHEFEYLGGEPGTRVLAYYAHDDGSLFYIAMNYAIELDPDNAPIVDFALKTFTVLE